MDAAAAAVSTLAEGAAAPAPAPGPEEAGASHGAAEQLGVGGDSTQAAEGTQSGPDAAVPMELQESAPAHVWEEANAAASPKKEAELAAPLQAAGDGADAGPAEAEALADGDGGDELDEESAEERGKRIAAQWTHDPEAVGEVAEVRALSCPTLRRCMHCWWQSEQPCSGTCRSRRTRLLPGQSCPSQALQRARLKRRRKPGQVCHSCSLTLFSSSPACVPSMHGMPAATF